MRELFSIFDDLVDVQEELRKTAPTHKLSEEQKKKVGRILTNACKKIEALKRKLEVE